MSIMPISSSMPMFDHLLESSHGDDSSKWSNIGFIEEMIEVVPIEVNFLHCFLRVSLPFPLEECLGDLPQEKIPMKRLKYLLVHFRTDFSTL